MVYLVHETYIRHDFKVPIFKGIWHEFKLEPQRFCLSAYISGSSSVVFNYNQSIFTRISLSKLVEQIGSDVQITVRGKKCVRLKPGQRKHERCHASNRTPRDGHPHRNLDQMGANLPISATSTSSTKRVVVPWLLTADPSCRCSSLSGWWMFFRQHSVPTIRR